MSEVNLKYKPLISVKDKDGKEIAYYVAVSHQELDYLIGRLMQICDLTGDLEQRTALKSEIKHRSRDWLDDLYSESGYDKWSGLKENIKPVVI